MEAINNMNGSIWIFAFLLVGMVVVQALLFLRLALNFNKKHNLLTKEEMNLATRTGLITAIGPAVGVLPIVLSLIVLIGSGATFMRCGVIGAPVFELMVASLTSQILGVALGSEQFTEAIFTLCLFGMGLSVAGYFLNTMFTLKPLDAAVEKSEKSAKRSFVPYMSSAAMMGLLISLIMDKLSNVPNIVALAAAGVISYGVMTIAKKTGNKSLGGFTLAIAMVCAMVIGEVLKVTLG